METKNNYEQLGHAIDLLLQLDFTELENSNFLVNVLQNKGSAKLLAYILCHYIFIDKSTGYMAQNFLSFSKELALIYTDLSLEELSSAEQTLERFNIIKILNKSDKSLIYELLPSGLKMLAQSVEKKIKIFTKTNTDEKATKQFVDLSFIATTINYENEEFGINNLVLAQYIRALNFYLVCALLNYEYKEISKKGIEELIDDPFSNLFND